MWRSEWDEVNLDVTPPNPIPFRSLRAFTPRPLLEQIFAGAIPEHIEGNLDDSMPLFLHVSISEVELGELYSKHEKSSSYLLDSLVSSLCIQPNVIRVRGIRPPPSLDASASSSDHGLDKSAASDGVFELQDRRAFSCQCLSP